MQLLNMSKASHREKRIRLVVIIGLVIVVVGAWLAYRPALNRYKVWKQERALTQARDFLAENDLPSAKLALDVAFAAMPGNPEALRVAARLLEQAGSPEVLPLRRRLVQIAPDSVEDRAALVVAAIRFKDLNAARDALRGMSPEQANQPVALKAALAYAMATVNRPVADALYDRLRKEEPDNENLKVMHAILRLQSPNEAVEKGARQELATLSKDPRNTLFIQRELMMSAATDGDFEEAQRLADKIIENTGATLSDRLHRANLLINQQQRPFDEVFGELTSHVDKDVSNAAELSRWALTLQQPVEVERWIASLDEELRNSPELRSLEADAVAMQEDWDRLGRLLEEGVWGQVKKDTVKLAFSTRIGVTLENAPLQKQLWDGAISSAGKSLSELRILHRLANLWQEEEFAEKTLWVITRGFPGQTWASQTLFSVYRGKQDTESLRSLMNVLREQDGTVLRYKYDWALLSLLTQRSSVWSPPKTAMHELYTLEPTNASYATGYAFALAQADKADEALAIIDALTTEDRALPSRAPYLAFIYGVGRRAEDYERMLAVQPQLTQLLPEENWLFALGKQMLDRPLPEDEEVDDSMISEALATSDDNGAGED